MNDDIHRTQGCQMGFMAFFGSFRELRRTARVIGLLGVAVVGCTANGDVPSGTTSAAVTGTATPLPAGYYKVGPGIYYSNGAGGICGFSSWNDYIMAGGPADLSGVSAVAALPTGVPTPACNVAYPPAQASNAPLCTGCVSFSVSAPEAYVWPSSYTSSLPQPQVPDGLFTVVPMSGYFVGYVGDQSYYALSASSVLGLNIQSIDPNPVIGPGAAGQFDECGAWIHGADLTADAQTVRGWYHAESGYCHGEGANAHPTKSVAYAVSPGTGLSFAKTNYPNNLVLAASPEEIAQASTSATAGDGDFSVVKEGGFYFMFFMHAFSGQSGVAAANVGSGGVPGSWLKWNMGSYSQPGVGGASSDIGPLLAGVSHNGTIGRFVGMTYQNSLGVGFQVAMSPDATSWTVLPAPLVPTGTRWADFDDTSYGVATYPSIVAPDGSKEWSNVFYLYYLYIRPGDSLTQRFGVVSQVTMSVSSSPIDRPQASTALERYYSPSATRHWVTSGLAIPEHGSWDFQDEGRMGGVFTLPATGMIELDDCVYGDENYLVSSAVGTCDGNPSITKLRTIGWVYDPSLPQPSGTHAIYRCSASADHFVSVDPKCEGTTTEALLGYALD